MALIPFIFFLSLTVYWWKRNGGLDICTYMTGLYAFCSLCATILVVSDEIQGSGILWDGWNAELNIIPTVFYCLLIGICIFPFSFLKIRKIEKIESKAPITLIFVSLLLVAAAIVNLYCVADSTLDILQGDLKAIRDQHYEGDMSLAEIKAQSLPYLLSFIMYFKFATILALPIMFYYICFENKPWWWNAILFLTSLTMPLAGIQMADRTEMIYYGLMFIYCLIFFYRFFTKKIKIWLVTVCIALSSLMATYLIAVSVARFEDTDNGTSLSMFQYGAQNYLNFCFFWENANFDEVATEREFPMTTHYLLHVDNDSDRRAERSAKQGFFISVFASFMGDIMLDLTPLGAIIWGVCFALLVIYVIRRYDRTEYNTAEMLALFILGSIPIFGIFYYRYWVANMSYIFIFIVLLAVMSRFKIVLRQEKSEEDAEKDNYTEER